MNISKAKSLIEVKIPNWNFRTSDQNVESGQETIDKKNNKKIKIINHEITSECIIV